MYERTDESDAVIALAGDYFKAMLKADESELRRVFHSQALVIGHWEGSFSFDSLDEFIESTAEVATGDGQFKCRSRTWSWLAIPPS